MPHQKYFFPLPIILQSAVKGYPPYVSVPSRGMVTSVTSKNEHACAKDIAGLNEQVNKFTEFIERSVNYREFNGVVMALTGSSL